MEPHLGTNWIPLVVLLPLALIVAIGIGWLIAKTKVEKWKRVTFGIVGIFAVFGFAITIVTIYYNISSQFAGTFNFYAYSALAPGKDPFQDTTNETEPVLMIRDVWAKGRTGELVKFPNPDGELVTYLFVPGKFIEARLKDNTLNIPKTEKGGLPAITKTSLWWALSKDLHKLNFQ